MHGRQRLQILFRFALGRRALFRCDLVEHGVVDHQPAFLRNAGNVTIAIIPADVLMTIKLARVKILRRIIVDPADIERQNRVSRGEIDWCHPI